MRISNLIIPRFIPARFSLVTILIYSLFVFILLPSAYAQDDQMETAIRSIWPDKQIEILKKQDDSFGNVVLQNYGALVKEGEYEYRVIVNVVPSNAPSSVYDALNMDPIESKQYEVDGLPPPVWISPARDVPFYDVNFKKRANTYINQETEFRCGNIYVVTAIIKDSGSATANPGAAKQWTQKLLPLSKEFAQRVASSVFAGTECGGGGCNVSEIYSFYKKFLGVKLTSFAPLGVQYDNEYIKYYNKNKGRALGKYPQSCPTQTKKAMIKIINEGVDAPQVLWRITAKMQGFNELKGTPQDYSRFYNNLGNSLGGAGMRDVVVRRFVHYPRYLDLQYDFNREVDEQFTEMMIYILEVQFSSVKRAMTENYIDFVSYSKYGGQVFDPKKAKFYKEVFDFTSKTMDEEERKGKKIYSGLRVLDKASKNEQVVFGAKLIREVTFFLPALYNIGALAFKGMNIERSFEELQADYPQARKDYEQALLKFNILRLLMREGVDEWKALEEKNQGESNWLRWPEPDRSRAIELRGTEVTEAQSLFALYLKDHEIFEMDLIKKRDAFMLNWILLGYPEDEPPIMEVIY